MKVVEERKMNLVSVIVPIYKVEEYLDRCIQSIIKQSWKHLELILVDDGSPDHCPAICDKWKEKDKRIKVLHKMNGGLSDARNAGLKIASGDYITFIDSDDWVDLNYLKQLLDTMENNNCDIVECEVFRTSDETEIPPEKNQASVMVLPTELALEKLIEDNCFHQYVWNKLYKRSVVDGILFKKGKINEDEFWTYQIFGNAKMIGKINVPLYFYFQRDSSIMGSGYSLKRLDALEAKMNRQLYIEKNYPRLTDTAKVNLYTSCIYQGQMTLLYLKGKERLEAKKRIYDIAKKSMPKITAYSDMPFSTQVWIIATKFCFWGTCRVKNFLKKGF